jgi:hypothetical protein
MALPTPLFLSRSPLLQPEPSSRLRSNLSLLIALSHEHIQSVTILPDHGVLGRRTGRINLEAGDAAAFRLPHQRASVER